MEKNGVRGYIPQPDLLIIIEDKDKERRAMQGISPLHLVDFTQLEQSVITSDYSFSRLDAFRILHVIQHPVPHDEEPGDDHVGEQS